MARTSVNTQSPPRFHPHCLAIIHRTLARQRPVLHPRSSLIKTRWELSLLLSRSTKTQAHSKWSKVLRRPLLCLIQPRVSPGTTMHKFRWCPRLRLCYLLVLRRPCRLFFRRGASRLGPAVAEPLLLASLRPPWITGSIDRALHRDQPPPSENRARPGPTRLLSCARALRRPSSCCADSTRHRCGPTCSALAWCPPSRGTSACQYPSRSTRDAGRNRVH